MSTKTATPAIHSQSYNTRSTQQDSHSPLKLLNKFKISTEEKTQSKSKATALSPTPNKKNQSRTQLKYNKTQLDKAAGVLARYYSQKKNIPVDPALLQKVQAELAAEKNCNNKQSSN